MKAFIYFNASLRGKQPKDYSGEGGYVLVTEDNKCIGRHYCSSRSFANSDLTVTEDRIKALQENSISEVYSNGNLVWKDDKITDAAEADFHQAKEDYEGKYCNN